MKKVRYASVYLSVLRQSGSILSCVWLLRGDDTIISIATKITDNQFFSAELSIFVQVKALENLHQLILLVLCGHVIDQKGPRCVLKLFSGLSKSVSSNGSSVSRCLRVREIASDRDGERLR